MVGSREPLGRQRCEQGFGCEQSIGVPVGLKVSDGDDVSKPNFLATSSQ